MYSLQKGCAHETNKTICFMVMDPEIICAASFRRAGWAHFNWIRAVLCRRNDIYYVKNLSEC